MSDSRTPIERSSELPKVRASSEFTHIIWASHLFSYASELTHGNSDTIIPIELPDDLKTGQDLALPTGSGSQSRILQVLADCIVKLFGRSYVSKDTTAVAIRDGGDRYVIELARQGGFIPQDEYPCDMLQDFLAFHSTDGSEPTDEVRHQMYHHFLNIMVIYNAPRLYPWIAEAAELMKDVKPRALGDFREMDNGGLPRLGCWPDAEPDDEGSTVALLTDLIRFIKSWDPEKLQSDAARADRLTIVNLAAAVVRSGHTNQVIEQIPGLKPVYDKLAPVFRMLARPAHCTRILGQLARQDPKISTANVVRVDPPRPARLRTRQVPTISKAWDALGFSPLTDHFAAKLAENEKKFAEDCARELPVLPETQLVRRYEDDPSLALASRYIAVSRPISDLSALFLQTSVDAVGVPGGFTHLVQHGVWDPVWGIGPCQSEAVRAHLGRVLGAIKSMMQFMVVRHRMVQLKPSVVVPPQAASEGFDDKGKAGDEAAVEKKDEEGGGVRDREAGNMPTAESEDEKGPDGNDPDGKGTDDKGVKWRSKGWKGKCKTGKKWDVRNDEDADEEDSAGRRGPCRRPWRRSSLDSLC